MPKPNWIPQAIWLIFFIFLAQNVFTQDLDKSTLSRIDSIKTISPESAADLLLQSILEEDGDNSKLFSKYRPTFLKLTADEEKRKVYHEAQIQAVKKTSPLDTLGLVNSYFSYASDLKQAVRNSTEALFYIEKAMTTWEAYYTIPTELYAQLLLTRIAILSDFGAGEDVLDDYEEVFAIYEGLTEDYDENMLSSLQIGFAKNLIRYGFYDRAEYYLGKVEKIYRKNAAYFREAEKQTQNEFAYPLDLLATRLKLFTDRNDEAALLRGLERVEAYIKDKKLSKRAQYYYASCYNYVGLFFFDNNRPESALPYFQKALEKTPKDAFVVYRNYFKLNVAKAKKQLGSNDEALQMFAELEPQLPRQLKGFLFVSRASIWAEQNETEKMLKDVHSAIICFSKTPIKKSLQDEEIIDEYEPSTRLNDAIKLLELAKSLSASQEHLQKKVALVKNHVFKISLKQFKNSYRKNLYTDKLEVVFDEIISGILRSETSLEGSTNSTTDVVESLVNFKSKFLWHHFLLNQKNTVYNAPDSLLSLEKQLSATILNLQLSDSTQNSNRFSDAIADKEIQLKNVQSIIETYHNSYNYFEKYTFELSGFQKKLGDEQVIYQYNKLGEKLYLFKIKGSSIETADLGDYRDIASSITEYLKLLGQPSSKISTIQEMGLTLFSTLGFSENELSKQHTIIPDKILNYFPFETLTCQDGYLVETTPINYSSSISFLGFEETSGTSQKKDIVIFTPSYDANLKSTEQLAFRNDFYALEGALQEGKLVESITNGVIFSESEASKSNFLENASEKSIIHLAMHAFLNNEEPELSSLIFTDGPLYLSELYNVKFNTDLVVLSACDTGIGKFETGKGVISLNNAFLYAGVPNTISTLWSISDKYSKNIMEDFYKSLKEGNSTAVAIQKAKTKYLKNTSNAKLRHPFYWAGFIHRGKSNKIEFPSIFLPTLLVGVLLLVGIIGFFIYKKRIE